MTQQNVNPASSVPNLEDPTHSHFRGLAMDHVDDPVESILSAVLPDVYTHLSEPEPDPLPVARLATSRRDGSLLYAMTRVDSSGRITDHALLRSVSWKPDERIALHLTPGAIVFQPRATGLLTATDPRRLTIPAAARNFLNVDSGSKVLLAAIPEHRLVLVYPLSTLDILLSHYHASIGT